MKRHIKLEKLIGSICSYKMKEYKINSYEFKDGKVIIKTDSTDIVFDEHIIDEALLDFNINKTNTQIKIKESKNEMLETTSYLNDVLIESIEEVRENASYIPRANSICKLSNSVLNTLKFKLQLKK